MQWPTLRHRASPLAHRFFSPPAHVSLLSLSPSLRSRFNFTRPPNAITSPAARGFSSFHPTPQRFNLPPHPPPPTPALDPPPLPTFRQRVGPTMQAGAPAFAQLVARPGVVRQVLFVAFGSFLVYLYAVDCTNYETAVWTAKLKAAAHIWTVGGEVTSVDLRRAQHQELVKDLRDTLNTLQSSLSAVPTTLRAWLSFALVSVLQPYADASEGKRVCWKLCMLNAAVWLAWKSRSLRPVMRTWGVHDPLSGRAGTLATSMFSHKSFIHLLANCLALESFGSAAHLFLVKEQAKAEPPLLESTGAYHFVAFFLTAGLFSGLVSHIVSAKFKYPRLVSQLATPTQAPARTDTWASALARVGSKPSAVPSSTLSATAKATAMAEPRNQILPSLGASGAIYACVTLSALAFPNAEVALFIPPSYPLNIQTAVGGAVLLDMVGIWRGWRMFDHWAHLGGAAFGVLYWAYGPHTWNEMRQATQDSEEQIIANAA